MNRSLTALIACVSFGAAALTAQSPAPAAPPVVPPTPAEIARNAELVVKGYDAIGTLSGVVLVAKGDQVLYQGAAGFANPEFNVRNTIDTSFRLPALSQLFTAVAIMRLQENGKLSVKDPAARYMPDWPESHKAITIHQLLIGESGIKDVTQMPDFVKSVAVARTPQELAAMILKEPLAAAPGTRSLASNSNYHLLAALVERAAGLSYNEYLRREVFTPLGLEHTRADLPTDVVAGRASGLVITAKGVRQAEWFHMSNAVGVAGVLSTAGDIHRFFRALVSGRLISRESLAQMTTDHVPSKTDGPASTPGVGYGINVLKSPTRTVWVNGGTINGFTTNLFHDVGADTTIIVLSNVSSGSDVFAVTNQMTALIAGRPFNVPVVRTAVTPRAEDIAAVSGTWELANAFTIGPGGTRQTATMTFRAESGRLLGRNSGGAEYEWFAEGPGRFFARHTDAQLTVDAATREVTYVTHGRKQVLHHPAASQ